MHNIEYINYKYPSYKVDASNPGTEVAAETAASLASASILFKGDDSAYSATLLKHAIEIYDFAYSFRGDYTATVPASTWWKEPGINISSNNVTTIPIDNKLTVFFGFFSGVLPFFFFDT